MSISAKKSSRKRKPARQLGAFVGKVMEPVLARRSGMTLDLLAAWPELAGEEYGDFTRPEKIKWPNRAHESEPFKPGILVVACDGARAIYFQHDLSRICARLNVFFGFTAIEKIQIVQKPVKPLLRNEAPELTNLSDDQTERLQEVLSHVEDEKLRAKLEKLGRGVMGRKK